jgi:hypothetical protein
MERTAPGTLGKIPTAAEDVRHAWRDRLVLGDILQHSPSFLDEKPAKVIDVSL